MSFQNYEMESRDKVTLCRLCLCENEYFINIFEMNDCQEYVAAEVISDLLQCQVSETDVYPHVVCSKCIVKLTDFKLFKECCQMSIVKYDNMFVSRKNLKENKLGLDICDGGSGLELCEQDPLGEASSDLTIKSEEVIIDSSSYEVSEDPVIESEVTIKSEEVIIDSSSYKVSEDPLMETEVRCGPILLKYEVLPFSRDSRPQEELFDSEVSGNKGIVESTAELMQDSPEPVINQEELVNDCTSGDETDEAFKGFDSEDDMEPLTLEPENSDVDSTEESCHDGSGFGLCQQDPLGDASSDNDMKPFKLEPDDGHIYSTEVELTLLETVTHPKYVQCLENNRPHCTSNGNTDADSCSNDDSILEKSKNLSLCKDVEASSSGTMERLHGQRILQGQSMYMVPLIQQDTSIGKEVKNVKRRMEENVAGEGEGWKRACPDKGVKERKGLECFHCGVVLLSKRSLIQHMEVHGFVNSYECDICDKVFRLHSDFIRHGLLHTDSMRFNCAECSKSFSTKGSLNRHMTTHTGLKPYKCSECSKCFSQKGHLNVHMRSHSGYEPYKCAECSKYFSEKVNLNKHMRLHTGSKPYKCAECSKCFRHNGHLNVHMRSHSGYKPYKCSECSKCFSVKCNLIKHMRLHTSSKPYKCAECSKCFSQNDLLDVHIRSHSGYKPYKCSECSKCFSQKGHLNVHMRSHSGYKPYKCAECSKYFSEKGNLHHHMTTHTGSKPYKCAECSKCFRHNGHLNVHMRSHSGYKPYKCSECSKCFSVKCNLIKHMRWHTVSKP